MGPKNWLAVGLLGCGLAVDAGCRSSLSYYRQGVDELESKQYDAAIESFTEAIEKAPESDLAYLNRGDAFFAKNDYQNALQDYDRAITLLESRSDFNPWFYNRRGLAHYWLAQYDKALADWRKAKDLEDRRASRGFKIRKSDAYVKMQELREELLPETERQASLMPAAAGSGAVGAPATEVASAEPSPTPSPTPSPEPAPAPEPTTPDEAAALEEARIKHELARLREDERRRNEIASAQPAPAPTPPAPEPAPAPTPAPEPAPAPAPAPTPAPTMTPDEEAAAIEEARVRRAAAENRPTDVATSEPAPAPAPAPEPTPAPAPAAEPAAAPTLTPMARTERPRRAAKLTGNWTREVDGLVFSFVDDGFRVVGEAVGSEEYEFYDVTLEWKDERTLVGYGTLKEAVTACKFETSVQWSVDVVSPTKLKAMVEEVGWNDQCQEADRAWVEHAFDAKR